MDIQLSKWGNSLAVRIPADYVRHAGLKEGDALTVTLTADGCLNLRPGSSDRKTIARELAKSRRAMKMTKSVLDELRRGERY
jgi:antitoxin MazE